MFNILIVMKDKHTNDRKNTRGGHKLLLHLPTLTLTEVAAAGSQTESSQTVKTR